MSKAIQVTVMKDGAVELWLDRERSLDAIVEILHTIAAGLADNPERIA